MAIIQSLGAVQSLVGQNPVWDTHTSVALYEGQYADYAKIYRTQPNVRTVIDFLSRNMAQLGLHLFNRQSDNDRTRVTFHDATEIIQKPNAATTRYRHFDSTFQDLGIYHRAFWLKVRPRQRGQRMSVVRCPPASMQVEGGLIPSLYLLTINGRETELQPSEVVHFRGYNPENPLDGLSPMETLRRILAEENAASDHRQGFWLNAGQVAGFFERSTEPGGAGKWTAEQVDSYKDKYAERYAGGKNAGKIPVLPPGMSFKQAAFSPREAQSNESRELAMRVCATAYHVPLPMVGIFEGATYSNVRELHKHLYQDCFGPTLVMMEEELELQLLPEFDGTEKMYYEFNIAEKLKGSFEEQATAIRALTGNKQILTQNEARGRLNLPQDVKAESNELSSDVPGATGGRPDDPDAIRKQPERQRADTSAWSVAIRSLFSRQQQRMAKVAAEDRAASFDVRRWTSELAADLKPLYVDGGMSLDEAETTSWKVAAGINHETLVACQAGRFPQCFTAARAELLAERIVTGVV